MADVVEAVEHGFGEYKKGRCFVPVRMPVQIEREEGVFLFMPAYLEGEPSFGTKMISVFPGNLKYGLSTLQAIYILNDPRTGELLALMDGILLTAMRTGAASAVATKYLARKDASVVGVIGTGAQAPYQVLGVSLVRPIRQILAFDTDKKRAKEFSETLSRDLGIGAEAVASPRDVVVNADILVTVTTSREPVFRGADLKPGTHINAVGAYTPEMREIDDVTVRKARIVVDTHEGCMAEAGDLLIPLQEGIIDEQRIYADLGEIVLGRKSGRRDAEEITLFESVGFALEDLVTARLALQRAREKGKGLGFSLEEP
jgi:ornithine cyclodeaminase/alanine dehydrogenase-like protein (mu-crystallin family)